jgi:hypothetical protein
MFLMGSDKEAVSQQEPIQGKKMAMARTTNRKCQEQEHKLAYYAPQRAVDGDIVNRNLTR